MSAFENRVATLLQDAVPEPGRVIDVARVERRGRRRRAVGVAMPAVTIVVVILAVVAAITIAGRRDKPVPPAATTVTYLTGGLTVRYPSDWHRVVLDIDPGFVASRYIVADDPTAFITSQQVETVCEKVVPSGQWCRPGVRNLGATDVYVGTNEFRPKPPDTVGPGLDTRIAGRPASVIERVNVNEFCPRGTASTTDVVIALKGGRYLSILGCLGSSDQAKRAFQRLLDSARNTG